MDSLDIYMKLGFTRSLNYQCEEENKRTENLLEMASAIRTESLLTPPHDSFHFRDREVANFEIDLAPASWRETKLYQTIKSGNVQLLLTAMSEGEDAQAQDPEFTTNYLHVVVQTAEGYREHKYAPMLYALCNAGLDVNATDCSGVRPIQQALRKTLTECTVALLRNGAVLSQDDWYLLTEQTSSFQLEIMNKVRRLYPGLDDAIENGEFIRVKRLLNCWCRVHSQHEQGKNLIDRATQLGHTDIAQLLKSRELTIELAHAVMAGDGPLVRDLLARGADPTTTDHCKVSVNPSRAMSLWECAESLGHKHLLHVLPPPPHETYYSGSRRGSSNPQSQTCVIV